MEVQWPLLVFSVLLGVTSGSFVFLAVGELTGRFKNVRFLGALIAFVFLAVGGCVSVLHMGHPERATHLLGNLGSGLSKELFVVAIMGIVAFAYLVLAKKDYPGAIEGARRGGRRRRPRAAVRGRCLVPDRGTARMGQRDAAAHVHGRRLGDGHAAHVRPRTAGANRAAEDGGFAAKLALVGVVAMVVTALAYVAWIALAPYQDPTRSLERLISGDFAVAFWVGVVVVGLAAPLALAAFVCARTGKGPLLPSLPRACSWRSRAPLRVRWRCA